MMIMRTLVIAGILLLCGVLFSLSAGAEDLQPVILPAPDMAGGKPLMQALKERQSSRAFSTRELPPQVMADLLWAACGFNRPESGMRTAPTAKNLQEIDVYVATAAGLYLYDAVTNTLLPVVAGDLRPLTGAQPFVKDAPLNLVFVANTARMEGMDAASVDLYTATDTGFISQNVYLYCASAGLATVVRGWLDRDALAAAMRLKPGQRIILAQTVGYPKE